MISDAMQAMDFHTNLCEIIKKSDVRAQLDRAIWIQSVDDDFADAPVKEQLQHAKKYLEIEHTYVSNAQTVYVSDTISEEIQYAANKMPDNVLLAEDVFVPNGLIILETPYIYQMLVDNSEIEETHEITAIHFINRDEGLRLYREFDGVDGISATLYGRWKKTEHLPSGEIIAYNEQTKELEFHHKNQIVTNVPEFVKQIIIQEGGEATNDEIHRLLNIFLKKGQNSPSHIDATFYEFGVNGDYDKAIASVKKFLLALFRMTNSYLEPQTHPVERHHRKRAERANRKIPENGYLTILKLRRTEYENGETKHNSPRYAFRVRGHWRNQYYATKGQVGDLTAYRHVYVNDYIKGKSKELRESTRVITINR